MNFTKQRIEALSDGVIAISLTIMMFSIPVPKSLGIEDVLELLRSILVFLASFTIVAFQWYKHNYLFNNSDDKISSRVVWYNFMFLFTISLIPVSTKLVIENPYNWLSIAVYFTAIGLVNVFYMTLANSVQGGKDKGAIRVRRSGSHFTIQLLMLLLLVAAVVWLAIYQPHAASIVLIILPVMLSIFSMLSFGEEPKFRSKGLKNESRFKIFNERILPLFLFILQLQKKTLSS